MKTRSVSRVLVAGIVALAVNMLLLWFADRFGIVTARGGFQRLVKLWTTPCTGGAPCCGMSCAIAITPIGPDLLCAPIALSAVVPAFAEAGGGIDPNGLKRPPRTPDIA